ncbi:MAG: hypothetical protein WCG30_00970 [Candidatus Saccharibacteria bacterium]
MKKILLILSIPLTILSYSSSVFATGVINDVCSKANTYQSSATPPGFCNDHPTTNPVYTILSTVLDIMSYVIGFVSVLVIIISGFRMIVSGGDSQTLNSSRNAIIYAIAGLAIAASAQIIILFVLNKL